MKDKFTSREKQVMDEFSKGRLRVDVAQALYMQPRTVDFHLHKIYEKLGVCNLTQAVIAWQKRQDNTASGDGKAVVM